MLHDWIADELIAKKSLSALIWLIDQGRELEFRVGDTVGFISGSHSAGKVSLWVDQIEQSFGSMEALIEHSTIHERPFCQAWKDVRIETLF